MENLEIVDLCTTFTGDDLEDVVNIIEMNNSLYFMKSKTFYRIHLGSKTLEFTFEHYDSIVLVSGLPFNNAIAIITQNKLVVVFIQVTGYKFVEYESENTIVAGSWNEQETQLCVVFEDGCIVMYSYDQHNQRWNTLSESNIDGTVLASVYVGWGSGSTQFQGRQCQPIRERESGEDIDQPYSPPKICWRGDGEIFVINYWKDSKRSFKVFNSGCEPMFKSDDYPGLQAPISFNKTNGNMIGCVLSHSNGNKILICEKNGKEKLTFDVPDVKGVIEELKFHPQLNLLAVQNRNIDNSRHINLFLFSNFRWCLKQQIFYPENHKIIMFSWMTCPEPLGCKLKVITTKEEQTYLFRFAVNRCILSATCGVVDGKYVHFTFFDNEILPPLMNNVTIDMNCPVNKVLFNHAGLCAIIDAQFCIKILKFEENEIEIIQITQMAFTEFNLNFSRVSWNYNTLNVCLRTLPVLLNTDNACIKINVNIEKDNDLVVIPFSDTIEYNYEKIYPRSEGNVPVAFISGRKYDHWMCTFMLDFSWCFHINNNVVSRQVTSFFIYNNYLLLTLSTNKLYCIPLNKENLLKLSNGNVNMNEFFSRNIEQGATIVCVTLKDPRIILQLPRGNIETVTCRLITIDMIEALLEQNKWDAAINLIQIERLNWNLLIDLNSTRFVNNIPHFVNATQYGPLLSTICLDFSEENVLETLYSNCVNINIAKNAFKNKKGVFTRLLTYFKNDSTIKNLAIIAIMNVRHFNLKDALISIYNVYKSAQSNTDILNLCKNVISQVLLYSHSKDLYKEAYLLYDVDFVGLVAECCSLDPRVYEPQLEQLRGYDETKRRFIMSVIVKSYEKAIVYLLRCPEYQTKYINDFIDKHNLHDVAYKSCNISSTHFKVVSMLYAQYLAHNRRHEEAALVFKRNQDFKQALLEYCKALNWKQTVIMMSYCKVGDSSRQSILTELAEGLLRAKQIEDAALIYESYLGNARLAVTALLENQLLTQAHCVASKHMRSDLIDDLIKPKIVETRANLRDKIKELEERFLIYTNRLETVRAEKYRKLCNGGARHYDDAPDDLYSDGGSVTSLSSSSRSSRTTMSSRNRRKDERKKIDLRPGGLYEDIALIRAIYDVVVEVFSLGNDVRVLSTLSDGPQSFMDSSELQTQLLELQKKINLNVPTVWSDVFMNTHTTLKPEQLCITENIEHLDEKYRTPPPVCSADQNWKFDVLIF